MGKANGDELTQTETAKMPLPRKVNQSHEKVTNISQDPGLFQTSSNEKILNKEIDKFDPIVALTSYFSGDLTELDKKCHSMMEKTSNKHTNGVQVLYRCKVCGKEDVNQNLKSHIEIKHIWKECRSLATFVRKHSGQENQCICTSAKSIRVSNTKYV